MAAAPLNPLEAALRRISEDLRASGRSWALIGGLAVSARAEPRTTRDVDLAVAVADDRQAEALIFHLQSRGYATVTVLEQEAAGRLATVRLRPHLEGNLDVLVDLLFASSGIEPEIARMAEPLEILQGLSLPVARIGHLIALKLLARDDRQRPQDLDDLRALLKEAGARDLAEAREALRLIAERGYNRGKDLMAEFDRLLSNNP
jgi:predicted nucleotidyltransferase